MDSADRDLKWEKKKHYGVTIFIMTFTKTFNILSVMASVENL